MRPASVRYTGVPLFLYVIYMTSRRSAAEQIQAETDTDADVQWLRPSRNSKHTLSSLRDTLTGLDGFLEEYQKRSCNFGLNSHHCALSAMDSALNAGDWLNSAHSPGKRAQTPTQTSVQDKYNSLLPRILQNREQLAVLQAILDSAEAKVNTKSKRTCMFNLGGRCATELASAVADQYYYLNSANSPGRRRKRQVPKPINPN